MGPGFQTSRTRKRRNAESTAPIRRRVAPAGTSAYTGRSAIDCPATSSTTISGGSPTPRRRAVSPAACTPITAIPSAKPDETPRAREETPRDARRESPRGCPTSPAPPAGSPLRTTSPRASSRATPRKPRARGEDCRSSLDFRTNEDYLPCVPSARRRHRRPIRRIFGFSWKGEWCAERSVSASALPGRRSLHSPSKKSDVRPKLQVNLNSSLL